MNFERSWVEAEKIVMTKLCKATGSTEGQHGYRGFLPPKINVWALFTGGQGGSERTTWPPNVVSIHTGARIEAQFANREHIQIFVMQVVKALPIQNEGNVQWFRIREGGMAEPVHEFIPLANEPHSVPAVTVNLGCEIVFSTGGRL